MTILGANQGIDGTGVRGAESIIEGTVTVTQATDNVAFDGVQVNNTSDNLTQFKGIVVSGGADVTVENSWFHSTGPNGNNVNGDRGIELQSGATGTILIDGNLFGGVQDGAGNRFSTANWTTGVWSDGNSVGLTITGNTFDSVRTGLNLDGYDDATTNVSFNSFVESGSGISIGTPSGSVVTGIHNNTFDGVGSGFNLLNVATSQSLDLNATNNVSVSPTDAMVVLGGTASDTLTGSDGVDLLAGGAGADNLTGGAGADNLAGGTGADNLAGGSDADIFVYNQRSDAGTSVDGQQDVITGFTLGDNDAFLFTADFFDGLPIPLPVDFVDSGHVNATYFINTDVTITTHTGGTGQPMFVLDSVVTDLAGTLWFDAEGDNDLSGAFDVKIADMSLSSAITGFDQNQLLIEL